MTEQEILHEPFDINRHKRHFINYLEVIIDENGKIEYAIPSHQEYLIKYACDKLNITRFALNELCPKEYYCDFMTWLLKITDCISVWNMFYMGIANAKQKQKLLLLKQAKIYGGRLV